MRRQVNKQNYYVKICGYEYKNLAFNQLVWYYNYGKQIIPVAYSREVRMNKVLRFTPEELEELRRFDEEVDASDLTYEDYLLEDLVEDLLFPHRVVVRKKNVERHKRETASKSPEELKQKYKAEYAKKDKEAERRRKQEWYRKNKERIALQQRDYRMKTGRQKANEAM